MIIKNLVRRKGRTLLTIFGISIGVAAIIGLGALAGGLESGYNAVLTGSRADLILSQPDTFDISLSSVDQAIGAELEAMSEVSAVSGMLQGFVATEGAPIFFVFGYPQGSFALDRFQITAGEALYSRDALQARGTPLILGSAAANSFNKSPGDTLRLLGQVFRIVGVYETGDNFEDGGAVITLADAQNLLGKTRQVSLFYIQLKDASLEERLQTRVERLWPELDLSGTSELADKQLLTDILRGYVWAIAGLAIIIGGVGMMNAQLMAVMERTREIGVLRALGWRGGRILLMILGETLLVGIAGGVLGLLMGWAFLAASSPALAFLGSSTVNIRPEMIGQAFLVVVILGIVGGLYPAWRASRLEPVDALRYEGGTTGDKMRRLPFGGMAVQSLWQRTSRTLLTLSAIGLTVGAILALEAFVGGAANSLTDMMSGSDVEIVVRQADIADTSLSAVDDRLAEKIAVLAGVENVSGMVFGAASLPEAPIFLLLGYAPNEYAIRRFVMAEGERIYSNHQIMLGRGIAQALNKSVGDTLEVNGVRYRVVGIYESGVSWEELGGVISLRDAQAFVGRPRKSSLLAVKVSDPRQAGDVVQQINAQIPGVYAALTGEFVEQLPDMQNSDAMLSAISFLAIAVGGVGVMNTMLMSVLERTREIGVLRSLGWRRLRILSLILREATLLGVLGGLAGFGLAFALMYLMAQAPLVGDAVTPVWEPVIFLRGFTVAVLLGLLGGLYPAVRATRLPPVEALRYE